MPRRLAERVGWLDCSRITARRRCRRVPYISHCAGTRWRDGSPRRTRRRRPLRPACTVRSGCRYGTGRSPPGSPPRRRRPRPACIDPGRGTGRTSGSPFLPRRGTRPCRARSRRGAGRTRRAPSTGPPRACTPRRRARRAATRPAATRRPTRGERVSRATALHQQAITHEALLPRQPDRSKARARPGQAARPGDALGAVGCAPSGYELGARTVTIVDVVFGVRPTPTGRRSRTWRGRNETAQ